MRFSNKNILHFYLLILLYNSIYYFPIVKILTQKLKLNINDVSINNKSMNLKIVCAHMDID